ncbi:conserved hypothetical inner membrane protein [Neisseria gonorrhoeae]|uniref:Protoporphyrinogen IX oxidase n=1 Tax=Neisseria gonorrhoeae TaxID=485 RepID=A0A378VUX5_NEIGO|nr:conserved hypothetical inner membrane protein [Neisseria gonorrhoeae]
MAMIDAPRGNPEYVRLSGMAVRLYRFMSPLGFGAVVLGAAIPFAAGRWGSGWVHVKLCLGLMLLAYQLYCGVLLRRFQDYSNAFHTAGTACSTKSPCC